MNSLLKNWIFCQKKKLKALELTFDSIANVPVANASSVSDWNTFFNLPINGTPFNSVVIENNIVKLYGTGQMILNGSYWYNDKWAANLMYMIDSGGYIIEVSSHAFSHGAGSWSLIQRIELPECVSIQRDGFVYSPFLISLKIPKCTNLGEDVGDNAILRISGEVITITIPASLMTCNDGNPDGDIQWLQANKTVTIIQV